MAYIVTQLSGSVGPTTDTMCVIGNQEYMNIPLTGFNIYDWNEISIGFAFSICPNYNFTGISAISESVNNNSPRNACYFGLAEFQGNSFIPLVNTGNFAGFSSNFANNTQTTLQNYTPNGCQSIYPVGDNDGHLYAFLSNNFSGLKNANDNSLEPSQQYCGHWPTSPTPASLYNVNTGFCLINGMRFKIFNKGQTSQIMGISLWNGNSTVYGYPNSPNGMAIRNQIYSTTQTGRMFSSFYYTSGLANGSGALNPPTSFYIYNPFLYNNFRIHSFHVEKIS